MERNIFRALHMEQNEVVMCRFLADLLDPRGWHGCGTQFLESFIREFVELSPAGKEFVHLERTCVMTEYRIDNGRRIDIMLQHPMFSVPIEAKINAGDQQGQCYDYYPYARNAKLIYLTRDGHAPSEYSRRSLNGREILPEESIRRISWKKICDWLETVPETPEQIRQYTAAIRSFLSKSERQQPDLDLICDMLELFQVEMDQALTKRYNLKILEDSYKSYQIWEKQNLNFCPGLNYLVQSADSILGNGLQMWFRIEVGNDGCLSAGFCLVKRKEGERGTKENVTEAAAEAVKKVGGLRFILSRDNWWFVWRFSNGKQDTDHDDVPNFKTMNQCAANLLDAQNRPDADRLREFVEETIQIFEDQLLQYLKSLPEQ